MGAGVINALTLTLCTSKTKDARARELKANGGKYQNFKLDFAIVIGAS